MHKQDLVRYSVTILIVSSQYGKGMSASAVKAMHHWRLTSRGCMQLGKGMLGVEHIPDEEQHVLYAIAIQLN